MSDSKFRAVCDGNGRRWRVEGPGWTMQPEGRVTAAEAEAICRATAQALTLSDAMKADTPLDHEMEYAIHQ